jgi:hypothetical protein
MYRKSVAGLLRKPHSGAELIGAIRTLLGPRG